MRFDHSTALGPDPIEENPARATSRSAGRLATARHGRHTCCMKEDPRGLLNRDANGAVIDEVQRCPALFSYLQTRVDHGRRMGQFVLTGS